MRRAETSTDSGPASAKEGTAYVTTALASGVFPQPGQTAAHPSELWHRAEGSIPGSSGNHKPCDCMPTKSFEADSFPHLVAHNHETRHFKLIKNT